MDNTIILNNILTLFLLILVGFIAGKSGAVNKNATGYLSDILMKVALPATIFLSISGTYNEGILMDSLKIAVLTFVIHSSCIIISLGYTKIMKIPEKDRGVWVFASTFSNNGFMGFPIAYAILGKEGLFLASISNTVFNVLIFSAGIKIMTMGHESGKGINIRKLFLNNNNIAIILGIIFYVTQTELPQPILSSLNYMGNVTTPMSMFLVGLSISGSRVRDMFNDYKLYFLSAVRLLIAPMLAIAVMRFIPFGSTSLVPKVMAIVLAMPAPSATAIIAEQFNGNKELAAKVVFLTSILSIVTIPIVLMFI
nr:AEC family transporter [Sedimentibacter sp.]